MKTLLVLVEDGYVHALCAAIGVPVVRGGSWTHMAEGDRCRMVVVVDGHGARDRMFGLTADEAFVVGDRFRLDSMDELRKRLLVRGGAIKRGLPALVEAWGRAKAPAADRYTRWMDDAWAKLKLEPMGSPVWFWIDHGTVPPSTWTQTVTPDGDFEVLGASAPDRPMPEAPADGFIKIADRAGNSFVTEIIGHPALSIVLEVEGPVLTAGGEPNVRIEMSAPRVGDATVPKPAIRSGYTLEQELKAQTTRANEFKAALQFSETEVARLGKLVEALTGEGRRIRIVDDHGARVEVPAVAGEIRVRKIGPGGIDVLWYPDDPVVFGDLPLGPIPARAR